MSFEVALDFDWETAIIVVDDRKDYGEERAVAHGRGEDGDMYVITFTMRGEVFRIISARPFGRNEYKVYGH